MDEWYCRMGGQDFGPMPFQQLFQAASAGQLPPDAWVRFGGQDWIPITAMPQLAGFFQRAPQGHGTHVVRRERGSSSSMNLAAAEVAARANAAPVAVGQAVSPNVPPAMAAPVAQPVAVPVAQGVAVPVAQGVAVSVARGVAVPANRGPVPAGTPVGAVAVGSAVPAIQTASTKRSSSKVFSPPPPGSYEHDDDVPRKKKMSGSMIMLYALGGTAVGLALVAIVVIVGMGGSNKKKPPEDDDMVAAVEEPKEVTPPAEVNPEVDPAESKPAKPADKGGKKETDSGTTANPEKTPANDSGKQARDLVHFQTQKKWYDPRKMTSLSNKRVKLEFLQAWLATDAQGKKVESADAPEGNADSAASIPGDASAEPAEPAATSASVPADASYVFVQFKITNPGTTPLSYTSWNGPSTDTQPLLASDGTQLVNFVPPSATAGVTRTTGTVTLAPQQSVTETLVFTAPASAFTQLKLLLPQTALPQLGNGFFGWELHQEYLAAVAAGAPVTEDPATPVVDPVLGPPGEGEMPARVTNGGQPGSVDDLKKSLEGPPKEEPKPMPKPGPPSIKDLDKQFQEMQEGDKKKPEGAAPMPAPAGEAKS